MSQQTMCDGCKQVLAVQPGPGRRDSTAISGERMNGLGGGGLPDGRFDWCTACAQTAFTAVREARGHAPGGTP